MEIVACGDHQVPAAERRPPVVEAAADEIAERATLGKEAGLFGREVLDQPDSDAPAERSGDGALRVGHGRERGEPAELDVVTRLFGRCRERTGDERAFDPEAV